MAKKPTRLELHKAKFLKDGSVGRRLRLEELDDHEKKILERDWLALVKKNKECDPVNLYAYVLADWAVMCPHPQHIRVYMGRFTSDAPVNDSEWYYCESCKTWVINEDWIRTQVEVKEKHSGAADVGRRSGIQAPNSGDDQGGVQGGSGVPKQ